MNPINFTLLKDNSFVPGGQLPVTYRQSLKAWSLQTFDSDKERDLFKFCFAHHFGTPIIELKKSKAVAKDLGKFNSTKSIIHNCFCTPCILFT